MPSSSHTPDPSLTFNLYTSGTLDERVRTLAGLWQDWCASEHGEGRGGLWFFRYGARAPHLKVRFHGSRRAADAFRAQLSQLGPACSVPAARSGEGAAAAFPPLDPEDAAPAEHLETVTETTYLRRSSILGAPSWCREDDAYVGALTHALAGISEWVLGRYVSENQLDFSRRQNVLLQIAGEGIRNTFEDPGERRDYIRFHRDLLVRTLVLRSGFGTSKAKQVLRMYRAQAAQLSAAARRGLSETVLDSGSALDQSTAAAPLATRFAVVGEAATQAGAKSVRGCLEPPDPRFPALFRSLHLAASQVGSPWLDEGLLYHLLDAALAGTDGPGSVPLAPLVDSPENQRFLTGFQPVKAPFEQDYSWIELVLAGCRDEGWAGVFRRNAPSILDELRRGLALLRKKRLEDGSRALAAAWKKSEPLAQQHPSIRDLLGRFYWGAVAYLEYLEGRHDSAIRCLDAAKEAVIRAIDTRFFLLPMAPLLTDIPLQKARVALRRRRCSRFEEALLELRAIQLDRRPLCVLSSGDPIHYEDVARHLRSLPPHALSPEVRQAAEALMEVPIRMQGFMARYVEFYAPQDTLIPHVRC